MLRGEQLGALRRVDAVEQLCRGRRARDAHMDLGGARSRIICTILSEVVPRTIESSMSTTRLPLISGAIGVVLQLHAEIADLVAGLDEGAADIVRADDPELERDADCCA